MLFDLQRFSEYGLISRKHVLMVETMPYTYSKKENTIKSLTINAGVITYTKNDNAQTSGTLDAAVVTQTVTTTNSTYPVLFSATAGKTGTSNDKTRFVSDITVNPNTKTITATNFAGNASTASTLKTARKITVNVGSTTINTFNGGSDFTTGVTGTLAIANGGTSMTSNPSMIVNLATTAAANVFQTSPRPGVTGVLPVANGGTGQNNLDNVVVGKAKALNTARTISLTGVVTGSGTFDGSGNLSIATTNAVVSLTGASNYYDFGGIARTNDGTDYARIRFGQTATDKGYLEIAIADNGDEPIYVRQYQYTTSYTTPEGAFSKIYRQITLLDASGNTTFPGSVTASGFVGNASSATKLQTGRTIQTNLGSTSSATFDGSVNITPGVTGTLPIANGGTSMTSNPSMLVNVGSTTAANVFQASPRPGVTGTLSVAHGGTGQTVLSAVTVGEASQAVKLKTAQNIRVNLGSTSAASFNGTASIAPGVTGTLAIGNGGTGITANPSMLTNLGSTAAANVFAASPRPGVTGTLPIANGGTGATTAANARASLGAAAASHTHGTGDITSGTLSIARGGTGQTTAAAVRNALGLGNTTGALPVANGGTGATTAAAALTNLGAAAANHTHAYAATSHNHSADNITSGTLSIARGGTGQTTAAAVRNALGLGNTTGALPIANGGTGATTAAAALTNLGAAAASHTHSYAATSHTHGAGDITSGTLSIARGGTGASTAAAARTALGAAASDHTHAGYAASSHTHSEYAALSGAAFTGTIKGTAGATLGTTDNIEVSICQSSNSTLLVGRGNNKIVLGGLRSSVYVGTGQYDTITIGDYRSSINIGNDDFNTVNIGTGTNNVIKIGQNIVTIQGSNASLGANTYYNGTKLSELGGNVDLSPYAKLSGAAFTGSISNNDNATLGNMNYGQVKLVPNTNGSVYIGSSSNTSANGSQFYDYSRYFYAGDIAGSKINIGCKGGSSIQVGRSSNSTVNMGAASARIELGQASSTIGVGDYANTHVTIGASGSQIHLIGTAYYNGTPLGSGGSSSSYYGVCSTAAGTAAKTVSITGFSLITGVLVTVKFSNSITVANPTLNVTSTGAKTIYYRGYALPANAIEANSTYTLVYNGTQWEIVGSILSTS